MLYNNAAKIFGAEGVLCRRLEILVVRWIYKASGKRNQSLPACGVFLKKKFNHGNLTDLIWG